MVDVVRGVGGMTTDEAWIAVVPKTSTVTVAIGIAEAPATSIGTAETATGTGGTTVKKVRAANENTAMMTVAALIENVDRKLVFVYHMVTVFVTCGSDIIGPRSL